MNITTLSIILAFIVYILVMVGIGAYYMKRTKNTEDYFLGGRGLSGKVAALSAQASDMSGWLLMGLPGSIYAFGTGQIWIAIGLFIGTTLNWLFVAGPLRRYTIVANNSLTLPEFFTNRFKDDKKVLLLISSVFIAIFFLVYTASALTSGGKLFNSVFGIDYHIALTIGAVVILLYTFMGGFKAVCETDFFQGLLMLAGLLIVPIVACYLLGIDNIKPALDTTNAGSNFLNIMYNGDSKMSFLDILSQIAWGFGYFGMPHILIRFMAVKDKKELNKSKGIAIGWLILSLLMTVVIGVVGRAYLAPTILGEGGATSTENVFIQMILKVFTKELHLAFIAGIFLAGILAAIMSTADSQLLVTSSAISKDIYNGFVKKDATDKSVLRVGRISTIIITVIALLIAWDPNSSIMGLVSNAWAGFGATFGPLVLTSLFWKRTNISGAIAGMISGGLTVILWDYIPLINGQTLGAKTGVYSLLIGFFVSLIFIIVVSLLTKAPSKEILDDFEKAKDKSI